MAFYPSVVDTTTELPVTITSSTPITNPAHSAQHVRLNTAVVALEGYLGVSGALPMYLAGTQTVTGAKTFNSGKLLDNGSQVWDIRVNGATHGADCQTAISTTLTSANGAAGGTTKTVFIPSGWWYTTGAQTVGSSVHVRGLGSAQSFLPTTSLTGDQWSMGASSSMSGVYLFAYTAVGGSATKRTSGATIYTNGTGVTISDVAIDDSFTGVKVSHNVVYLFNVYVRALTTAPTAGSAGFLVNSTSSLILRMRECVAQSSAGPFTYGVNITDSGGAELIGCMFMGCTTNMNINATTAVSYIHATDLWLDRSVGANLVIDAAAGANVGAIEITNFYASFAGSDNIQIKNTGATGSIFGIHISNGEASAATTRGIDVTSNANIKDVVISMVVIAGCGSDGIRLTANQNNFRLLDNWIGTSGPSPYTANGGIGINIVAGTSDGYIATGNVLLNNTGGAFTDGGTGSNKVTWPNVGVTSPVIGLGQGSGANPTLTTSAHATKGKIYLGSANTSYFDEANNKFQLFLLNGTTGGNRFDIGDVNVDEVSMLRVFNTNGGTGTAASIRAQGGSNQLVTMTQQGTARSGNRLSTGPITLALAGLAEIISATSPNMLIGHLSNFPVYFCRNSKAVAVLNANNKLAVYAPSAAGGEIVVGGTVSSQYATVGNVGGGTDDLMTYSLPASTLGADGDSVEVIAAGQIANNANAKTLTINFGGTVCLTYALPTSVALDWCITMRVIRTGAATQRVIASLTTSSGTFIEKATYTTPTETLSGAVTIKCTGAATADHDIDQTMMLVRVLPV